MYLSPNVGNILPPHTYSLCGVSSVDDKTDICFCYLVVTLQPHERRTCMKNWKIFVDCMHHWRYYSDDTGGVPKLKYEEMPMPETRGSSSQVTEIFPRVHVIGGIYLIVHV